MILGYLYRRHENQVDLIIYRSKILIWIAFVTYIVAIYFANQSYSIMGSKYIVDCLLIYMSMYILINNICRIFGVCGL